MPSKRIRLMFLVGLVLCLLFVLGTVLFVFVPFSGLVSSKQETSVQVLLQIIPELSNLGITSADYIVNQYAKPSLIPSPSDTKIVIKGSVDFSEEGMNHLQHSHRWTNVSEDSLPVELVELVPPGTLLQSSDYDSQFESNRQFPHAVIIRKEPDRRIYFMFQNRDYPIRTKGVDQSDR